MKTAKEKVEAVKEKAAHKNVEVAAKVEEKKATVSNVCDGKITFKPGTTAAYILDLYRKHGKDRAAIKKDFFHSVEKGKMESKNAEYRVSRILYEIATREKSGYSI